MGNPCAPRSFGWIVRSGGGEECDCNRLNRSRHFYSTVVTLSSLSMYLRTGLGMGLLLAASVSSTVMLRDIADSPYRGAIEYLQEHGVINGYADGTFRPESTINRAELLKILVGSLGVMPSVTEFHDCFPDVRQEWFAPYVCYAREQGWIRGYDDGTFRPELPVNTAEAIKMIVNTYGYKQMQSSSAAPFDDIDPSAWYAPFVHLARTAGILDRTSGRLEIAEHISRGRISGLIERSMRHRSGSTASSAPSTTSNLSGLLRMAGLRRGGSGNTPLASPTITFNNISKGYGDADFTLVPASNSNGTFTYASSNHAVITITGNTATIVGAGTATITAAQAATSQFADGSATATITVTGITAPTITFHPYYHDYQDTNNFVPTISSNSSGSFTYESSNESVVASNGTSLRIVSHTQNASVTITATQAPSGMYTSGTATGTLTLEIDVDQCSALTPCHGGTCTRIQTNPPYGLYNDYECSDCPSPYSGENCTDLTNNCVDSNTGLTCSGNTEQGTCAADPSGGVCVCAPCFTGPYCTLDDLACA